MREKFLFTFTIRLLTSQIAQFFSGTLVAICFSNMQHQNLTPLSPPLSKGGGLEVSHWIRTLWGLKTLSGLKTHWGLKGDLEGLYAKE